MRYTIYIDKLKGSHYEIGKRKSEIVLSRYGAGHIDEQREHRKHSYLYRHLSRNFDIHSPENAERANVARKILERAHSGLLEEIKGFADGIGKTYEEALVMTASSGGGKKGCSHFIKNGLHAHNYDDSPDDIDSHLLLTYVEGDYSHVGFSNRYIGSLDGMNEKGLCVSLSFGGGSISDVAGIGAGIFERIILEQAASVEEAIEIFKEAEYVSPNILLLSDASGSSAVIEMDGDTYRIRKGEEAMMCFNHYSHPEMKPEQEVNNPTTLWREARTRKLWSSLSSKDDIIRFLASDFPEGLYEPYYSEGLGTLWSVVFEPGTLDVSVSIGKYPENKRLNFSFSEQEEKFSLPELISADIEDVSLDDRVTEYKGLN